MAFARPKKKMTQLPDGGVVLDIAWFAENPEDDPDMQPDFHGQQIIYVPTIDDVTPELIEEAIAKDRPVAEASIGKREPSKASARAVLGKVYDGVAISADVEARRKAVERG